ncbi:MAG: hypothetical protein CMA85_02740 [Euryarchaeota archaeon]|nr:hypothetical protein [Euryarchaeota archaeon]
MSRWILPTTADIGLRAFGDDAVAAMREAALGMQDIQIAEGFTTSGLPRNESVWTIERPLQDYDRALVRWLEETLYRAQAEGEWLCDVELQIQDESIEARVIWVDVDLVEREVEIKAVTMHEVALIQVGQGEVVAGVEPDIPSFEGPGWMAQVVFDI